MGHLKDSEMTWWQHFVTSWGQIWKFSKTILKLVIHSFFPDIWTDSGSKKVLTYYHRSGSKKIK